jgi:hypothetical protein
MIYSFCGCFLVIFYMAGQYCVICFNKDATNSQILATFVHVLFAGIGPPPEESAGWQMHLEFPAGADLRNKGINKGANNGPALN